MGDKLKKADIEKLISDANLVLSFTYIPEKEKIRVRAKLTKLEQELEKFK